MRCSRKISLFYGTPLRDFFTADRKEEIISKDKNGGVPEYLKQKMTETKASVILLYLSFARFEPLPYLCTATVL